MPDEADIPIVPGLTIPGSEIRFETSRSSGPGGQHVNKVESRVAVLFDVHSSTALSAEQKGLIRSHLSTRMSKRGILRVVAQKHRSQAANRKEVIERFAGLLRDALEPATPRRTTKVPGMEKRRRLEDKKRRSEVKQKRRSPVDWEG